LSTILKPLLALVITVLLFVGFTYLVDIELLEFVQTRFYNPSILNSYTKENNIDAEIVQNHIFHLQKTFEDTLKDPAVLNSFLYNQSAEDIFERSRVFGMLLETTSGLQTILFVDTNGLRIHYSTSSRDIISRNLTSTTYRNYNEDPFALPFDTVSVPAGGSTKYSMDERSDRIVFSIPFTDSMNVYRGTALFYVSIRAFAEKLIAEGRLKVNEDVSVIGDPPGILLGSPQAISGSTDIQKKVSAVWDEGIRDRIYVRRVTIDAEDSGVRFSLISMRTRSGLFFGRLINDYLFSIPDSMKLILELSLYLTFFLTLCFILNLRPNSVTLIRNRIKKLRDNLFEQLYVNKSSKERVKWILELEQRRDEIRVELKRNMRLRARQEKIIDSIIDKSWDELLFVIKSGSGSGNYFEAPEPSALLQLRAKADTIDDLEEIEEIEDIEEISDVEEITEETTDDLEDLADGEVEELAEEAEELTDGLDIDMVDDLVEEIYEELTDKFENIDEAEELDVGDLELEALEEFDELKETEVPEYLDDPLGQQSYDSKPSRTGLLKLIENKSQKTKKKKGLLALAENKEKKPKAKEITKGLLALAESKEKKQTKDESSIGLLALASKQAVNKPVKKKPARKGLLAAASEIEVEHEHEEETDDQQDLFAGFDIVSPFSSMFASLEENQ